MEPLVTVSRCLPLFLFFVVLSLARGQECPEIQENQLGGLIADAVTLGDSGSAPAITVLDSQTVCLAAAATRDLYRYSSVVVSFDCVGSLPPSNPLGDNPCAETLTVQFDFECVNSPLRWQRALTLGGDNVFNPSDGNLTTSLRTDCSFCVDPAVALGVPVDNATHCAACDDACLSPPDGLGFCTGLPPTGDCCNFYEDNTCTDECLDGSEAVDGMDCVEVCPTLDDPVNGEVNFTSRTVNSVATYSCDMGYMLVGSATRTCEEAQESTGLEWTGNAPTCMIRNCGAPPAIDNATPTTPTGTTFEATAVYTCNDMYELENPSVDTLTCGATGTWDGPRPACVSLCNPSCQNGDCVNGACVCPPGYTGSDCGVRLCIPECLNGGTCNNGECECPEGFAKPICQPCPPNCKECSTNDTCDVCEDEETLNPDTGLCDKPVEQSSGGGGGGCDIGCIIGIIVALLVLLAIAAIIAGVIYGLYRYQSNPTTKLRNKDTEGLNGVARDNPLYVDPVTVEEEVEAAAVAPAQDGEP